MDFEQDVDLGENKNVSSTSFNSSTEKSPVFLVAIISVVLLVVLILIGCGVYCFFCRDRSRENSKEDIRKERSKKRSSQKKTGNLSKGKHHRLSHRRGGRDSRHTRNSTSRSKPKNISSKVARMTSSEVIKLPPNVKLI